MAIWSVRLQQPCERATFSQLPSGEKNVLQRSAGWLFTANGIEAGLKFARNVSRTARGGEAREDFQGADELPAGATSLLRKRLDGLGTLSSITPPGNDQTLEQGAAQISELKAGRANQIRDRYRPDRCTLSEPVSRASKQAE